MVQQVGQLDDNLTQGRLDQEQILPLHEGESDRHRLGYFRTDGARQAKPRQTRHDARGKRAEGHGVRFVEVFVGEEKDSA